MCTLLVQTHDLRYHGMMLACDTRFREKPHQLQVWEVCERAQVVRGMMCGELSKSVTVQWLRAECPDLS